MRLLYSAVALSLISIALQAQVKRGFPFGTISKEDLMMKDYPKDTSASAVTLYEFAESHISNAEPNNLIFDYHVKIKILKREGFKEANYEIPLHLSNSQQEMISDIEASTFNWEDNAIKESKVNPKSFFLENRSKFWDIKKFAFPDVHVGSIIEIHYVLESPFIFNWRTWDFQSDIPKVYSEFWARIPGNYVYNIVLRGPLKLSKNESSIEKDCFTPGAMKADCALLKYAMRDIPAFKEEEYMTSKSNFISSVNFELSEVKRFDGTVNRYTEQWSDTDRKLQQDDHFGAQLKQAKKIWSDPVRSLTAGIEDPLWKARTIFNEIKNYYLWNETFGSFTELGAKKAYQSKKGNVADINLSLAGALQAAGIVADPVLVSTRANGLPIMLHPVMTDFNYLIVRVTIGADIYWLDATNRLHPFGFVPERCLNGKVRVMSRVSEWVELKAKDKKRTVTEVQLMPEKESLKGKLKISYYGYDAFEQRKDYGAFSSVEDYVKDQAKKWPNFEIENYTNHGVDSLDKPFVEIYDLNFSEPTNQNMLYISPFLVEAWQKNPFLSGTRTFPVDFGASMEKVMIFSLTIPSEYSVDEIPKNAGVSLQQGGRYLFNSSVIDNKVQVSSTLILNKPVYSPEEYFSLKELFARVIQSQQSQIVLRKK